MKRKFLAVGIFVITLAGTSLVAATPTGALFGGNITFQDSKGWNAPQTLTVCNHWGKTVCSKGYGQLRKGQSTRKNLAWSDADGLFVPFRCTATAGAFKWHGSGWVKVNNLFSGRVSLSCW